MKKSPLFAWKIISETDGFVAVVIAPSASAARARLKAKFLFEDLDAEHARTDEQVSTLFQIIDAARSQRFPLNLPGVLCRALV